MKDTFAIPKLYVYKTRNNYYNLVPVTLSEDKKEITSYPHPSDLIIEGKPALPIKLPDGYYLDIKGIDLNVAFLKNTYDNYSQLSEPPSIAQLKKQIKDADPLTELWDCGFKTNEPGEIEKISQWIESGKLADFAKRLK
jgi:hypothetical protein